MLRGIDRSIDVLTMTPYEVAMWFQQSDDPMLRQIGLELEPATYGHVEGWHITTDLIACLLRLQFICDAEGNFLRGSNAAIAEALFGSRSKTGGAYNAKIQEIKAQITAMFQAVRNATTTTPDPEPQPVALQRAA